MVISPIALKSVIFYRTLSYCCCCGLKVPADRYVLVCKALNSGFGNEKMSSTPSTQRTCDRKSTLQSAYVIIAETTGYSPIHRRIQGTRGSGGTTRELL